MGEPFEPMSIVDLQLLSWKIAFLVAITSAKRASELCAFRADPPYTLFHADKVVLRPDKVVTPFHLRQSSVLPVFFPFPEDEGQRALHTLDVRRALTFYIDRTKEIRKGPWLFVAYGGVGKGQPITPQRISTWITSTITLCHDLAGTH